MNKNLNEYTEALHWQLIKILTVIFKPRVSYIFQLKFSTEIAI